jgi:hypothetical protein
MLDRVEHAPCLLDLVGGAGEQLVIIGHTAQADPVVSELLSGQHALLVFQGPKRVLLPRLVPRGSIPTDLELHRRARPRDPPGPGRLAELWTSIPHEMKADAADAGSVQVARFRDGHPSSPGRPQWRHGQVTVSNRLSRRWSQALLARRSLGGSSLGDRERHGGGAMAVAALSRRPCPDRARRARSAGSTVEPRCGSYLAVPARLVGWSELGNQARAVTPRERPEDPPARGDRPSARLGIRQGPQLHLLAQARRPVSVHPADLRLALPGLPQLRAAVLQPQRPAVSGARHRAVGGGAGPAVASQGGDEGPPGPRRRAR